MKRSAVEIVRAYGVDAWTQGRDDLIPELCHDPIIRHDANREVRLSHAEQRARMRHNYEELRPVFEDVVLAGDDEHVTLVWNVTGRDPHWKWCGIEVFRVVDGRIAEVWNSSYMDGRWGLSKSLVASMGQGPSTALPLVRPDIAVADQRIEGEFVVPADTRAIGWWLACLFGGPDSEQVGDHWHHRFRPGRERLPLTVTVADTAGPSIALSDIRVPAMTIEWERSGLINAVVRIEAVEAPPATDLPSQESFTRLSETIGQFDNGSVTGRVVEAGIAVSPDGRARGRVALRLDSPDAATGPGRLSLGWREGEQHLLFEGDVELSMPANAFADQGEMEAIFQWEGSGFTASLVNDRAHI